MRIAIPVLALATLSACSSDQPPRTPPAMVPAGDPVNCIQTRQIRSTVVQDDQTIDFRMTNGQVFRNTLPNRCPGLASADAFSYRTSQAQLCSVDVIRVLNTGGGPRFGATCGLGQFVPVKPAEDAPAG